MIRWEDSTTEMREITPSMAQHMLEACRYERQRSLFPAWVWQYARAMRDKRFRPATLLTFAVLQGKYILVNGQHTLAALVMNGEPYMLRLEHVPVDTMADVAKLYGTYDQQRRRSSGDIYASANMAETLGLLPGNVTLLGGAMPLLVAGFAAYALHGHAQKQSVQYVVYLRDVGVRMACMSSWAPEARIYYELIRNCPQTIKMPLRRAAVISVALATIRHTGTDAETFWHQMAMGSGLTNDDPRLTLHHFLREKGASEYEPYIYARYIAYAWNHAWHNRKARQLRLSQEQTSTPILLAGTPHDGKQVMRYLSDEGEVLTDPVPDNREGVPVA